MLNNISPVTKNLLFLNVLMFIATIVMESRQIDLISMLGMHTFNSPLFEPYQVVSHFFMHGSFMHIIGNMFGLVVFGSFLEKLWGAKRFFLLYCCSALGGLVLFTGINTYEVMQLRQQLHGMEADLNYIDNVVSQGMGFRAEVIAQMKPAMAEYYYKITTPMIGASGAVFGVSAAFAILFPNTELMLMFPPIPIKAKYLIGGYFLLEIYQGIYVTQGDHIAHLAHVGGAIVGAVMVLYWRRKSNRFY